MRIYFAHPMSTYGSASETAALKAIREAYPDATVINPSDAKFAEAIVLIYPLTGMGVFDLISANSDLVIAMPFTDGKHGAGVYSELAAAHRAGKPLKLMSAGKTKKTIKDLSFYDVTALSVAATRERIKNKQK